MSRRKDDPFPEGTVDWADNCKNCGEPTRLEPSIQGGNYKIHDNTDRFLCEDDS